MDFVATLCRTDRSEYRSETVQARDIDDAASAVILSTYERKSNQSFEPGDWFVVAIRQGDISTDDLL